MRPIHTASEDHIGASREHQWSCTSLDARQGGGVLSMNLGGDPRFLHFDLIEEAVGSQPVADPGIETKIILKKNFMRNTTKFKEKNR